MIGEVEVTEEEAVAAMEVVVVMVAEGMVEEVVAVASLTNLAVV